MPWVSALSVARHKHENLGLFWYLEVYVHWLLIAQRSSGKYYEAEIHSTREIHFEKKKFLILSVRKLLV